jgi:hypothetical protein
MRNALCRGVLPLILIVVVGCQKETVSAPAPGATAPVAVAAPSPPPEEKKAPEVKPPKTLAEAVALVKPAMNDTFNEVSKGAIVLAAWSIKNMTWSELNKLPPTKHSLVMKDPDEERGKLLCGRGMIIELAAEKTEIGKVHNGGMFVNSNVYRFIAIGSTGELVAQNWAGFCGVVIGKQSYQNSMGGTAHAVFLVGMFSLPENKK